MTREEGPSRCRCGEDPIYDDTPPPWEVQCPSGCGCRIGTEDADRNDCACGGYCAADPSDWPAFSIEARSTPAEALDVERLHEAIIWVRGVCRGGHIKSADCMDIAARLTTTPTRSTPAEARAASQERPQPDELLRDLVQHWDAGDLDHNFDALSSAFDSAREYVGRSIVGEHRHPSASQERPSIDVERLALAWHMTQRCVHGKGAGEPPQTPRYLRPDREVAADIAAEYLRLSGPVGE